jgi:hypothetical protein
MRRDVFCRVLPVGVNGWEDGEVEGWEMGDRSLRIDVETLSPAAQKQHARDAIRVLAENTSHRVVHLNFSGDGDTWGLELACALARQRDLVELRISGGSVSTLLAFVVDLQSLKHLAVFNGDSPGSLYILPSLTADLEELMLSCVDLEGVRSIAKMRRLSYMCIYRARFGDDGMDFVSATKGLEDLEIRFDSDAGACPSIRGLLALTGAPNLKFVQLSNTGIRRADFKPDVITRLRKAFVVFRVDGFTIFDEREKVGKHSTYTRYYYHHH